MLRVFAVCGAIVLGFTATARAEWHFTPFAGFTARGNTTLVDPEDATRRRHTHIGFGVSRLGEGLIGAEILTIWTPGFFQHGDAGLVENSRTVVVMGNVVVTAPRRWTEYSLRPYVSAGLGLMHVSITEALRGESLFPIDYNALGFNIGGGATGFLTQRTGLRFDVRYHSTLNSSESAASPFSFGPVHLRYATASIGLVFRR